MNKENIRVKQMSKEELEKYKQERVNEMKSLFGILPKGVTAEDAKKERLKKHGLL